MAVAQARRCRYCMRKEFGGIKETTMAADRNLVDEGAEKR
jgi:L-lysine 2,3-aminomutase